MTQSSRVALLFGGRSAEHAVSVASARTVAAGLREAGHEVVPVGVDLAGAFRDPGTSMAALAGTADTLPADDHDIAGSITHLVGAAADVAFPLIHGTWGEDGTMQGCLEMLDLPYVGAGVLASAVAMDKARCKRVLEAEGLPVMPFAVVSRVGWDRGSVHEVLERAQRLSLPLFVKPSVGGSSVGIRKVGDWAELVDAIEHALEFDDTVLVEQGADGRELECAVAGYPELEAASCVGEIVPAADFYDYADKYLDDAAGLITPAELPAELGSRLRELAVAAFAAVGGTGMARVDFLLDRGEPFVNEINTIPGFTSISMYPRLWEESGLPLPELVDRLVRDGIARHADRHRLDVGIKSWIAQVESRAGSGS